MELQPTEILMDSSSDEERLPAETEETNAGNSLELSLFKSF